MRLFLAYDIDEETKKTLVDKSKIYKKKFKQLKWVKPENMHLTLKFLGEYEDVAKIIEVIDKLKNTGKIKKIENDMDLDKISGFPSISRSRILVAILKEDPILLKNYYELEKAMEILGFKREKRNFIPHITLARVKFTLKMFEINNINYSLKLSNLKLYRSILRKEGPIYTVIKEF